MLALFHLDSKIKEISNCVGPSLIDFEKVEKHKKLSLLYLDSTVLARFAFYINGIPVFYCQQITGLLFIAKITKTVGKKYRLGFAHFIQKQLCLGSPAISTKVNKTLASTLFLRKNILKNQWVLQTRHLLQIWLIILL